MTWAAPRRPSRREVLAGGGLLAVAGCLGPSGSPPADPFAGERRLRERVAREVSELSSAYDAVLARFPEAAGELATLAAEHSAHIAALRGPQPSASPAASSATTATTSPSTRPASVPPTVAEARVALAAAERAASERRTREAVTAPARTARLLASIAACEATHAALLDRKA